MIPLRFTAADYHKASDEWNCNCGPTSLAAALGLSLSDVRALIPNFSKGLTEPEMRAAILKSGKEYTVTVAKLPDRGVGIIFLDGPWMGPGRSTGEAPHHWVATSNGYVFDIWGVDYGWCSMPDWSANIVTRFAARYRSLGATGKWHALCGLAL